jgi:hypothetical protein
MWQLCPFVLRCGVMAWGRFSAATCSVRFSGFSLEGEEDREKQEESTGNIQEASQMNEDMPVVDITHEPSVVYLAEIVQRTRTGCLLRRNGEDVALLLPVPANDRRSQPTNTPADDEAFHQAAECRP